MLEALQEHYPSAHAFAKELNLPLLGVVAARPIPAGAPASTLLAAVPAQGTAPVVDGLQQTRQSLTLRSLLLAGFPQDVECFAVGLALAREWSRRGLRVALVDLDDRHPSVVRPAPMPSEGLLDMLEYGCSFRRVAWELVAGRLWLIGPGSHPPDVDRLVEHSDWERVARMLARHADATLFVAPWLDRTGLAGRLSKRVDGVLLAASVDRTDRATLRDAFLELWGSDAPMIGCVGIGEGASPQGGIAARDRDEGRGGPQPGDRAEGAEGPTARPAAAPGAGEVIAPSDSEARQDALVALLEREVRSGRSPASRRPRAAGRAGIIAGAILVGLAVGGGFWLARQPSSPRGRDAMEETMPAGTERVLPAALPLSTGAPIGPESPPAEPAKPYRVHVASFRNERTVAELARALRSRGLDAWYEPAGDLPGWYRVFVDRFATHAEARARAAWLLEQGYVDRAHAYPDAPR